MRPLLCYDEIFLSPHLDDAALSCGGQIARATRNGEKVLVITVFTGDAPAGDSPGDALSPLASELHALWGLGANPFAARRAEDRAACAILGADFEHWGFPDAIYRRGADGAWLHPSRRELLAPPQEADGGLLSGLTRRLSALSGLTVRGPLAVGGHVDHRLVRAALAAADLPGLELYEDFPYARSRKQRWLARGFALGWSSRTLALEPRDIDCKIAAIECFGSQLAAVFASGHDLRREVEKFAQARGGERLYSRL